MAAATIEVEGVVKRFGSTTALAGVDLVAEEAKVLALLGPNGAGKTTLVRILTTLLKPDSGSARVAGYDVVADARAAALGNRARRTVRSGRRAAHRP
jgi:ABC-type multidrug transport system ATPase subunit